ncbi:MAG: hypothetical protein KAT05_10915 [Spirochaetes bacterium]|nr:hypothetical protein [Spirochaetota bacterium]
MSGGGWIYYYHFNGDDGCDICSSMTGYYDEEPERPHPNCDCPIVDWINYGYKTVYKEKNEGQGSEYEQQHEAVVEFVNNSSKKVKHTLSVSETVEGEISVSAEIEGIFSVSGKYKASETITETVEVELEPGEGVSIDVIGIMKTVSFSAERWYITESVAGETQEIYDETISDQIEAVEGTRIVVNDL